MVDIVLEQRVINLEEMMADLIQQMNLSWQRMDLSQERTDLSHKRIEASLRASQERDDLSQKRIEANLRAHQERVEADLQAHRAEWQAETRKINKQWGELANKMGTLVEDLVAPSLPRILREVVACSEDEGISMAVRVRRSHPTQKGLMQEFDVIASCGRYALFNETKSSLAPADVDSLLAKLAAARAYFPEYQNHKLIGAVATLYIDPSLAQYATRQGILALSTGDELMDVMNEAGFELKAF